VLIQLLEGRTEGTEGVHLAKNVLRLPWLDWFKGKFTGNHGISHQIWCFPVDVPLNQSIECSEKCGKMWKTMENVESGNLKSGNTMGFSHEDHGAVRFHILKDQPAFPGKNVEKW